MRTSGNCLRWALWAAAGVALPKCVLCLAGYVMAGSVAGLEMCGESASAVDAWRHPGLLALGLVGLLLGGVVTRCARARATRRTIAG